MFTGKKRGTMTILIAINYNINEYMNCYSIQTWGQLLLKVTYYNYLLLALLQLQLLLKCNILQLLITFLVVDERHPLSNCHNLSFIQSIAHIYT